MERIIKYLDPGEEIIWVGKKHKFFVVIAIIIFPFGLFAIPELIGFALTLAYSDLFYSSQFEIIMVVLNLIIFMISCIVLIGIYNTKLIFTDKRVIIKKTFSRKVLLIPYKNIKGVRYVHRGIRFFLHIISIKFYGIVLYLEGREKIYTRCDFNSKNLSEMDIIFIRENISFDEDRYLDNQSLYVDREANYKCIKQRHLSSFFPIFALIIPIVLSAFLIFALMTGLNSKIGPQTEILITGTIIDVLEDTIDEQKEYTAIIKEDSDDFERTMPINKNLYLKIKSGMRVSVTAKKGCLGILYNIKYDLLELKKE